MIGTLDDIITKVRKLTGAGTDLQLTRAQIIDYINSFYLYDFPAEFRSLKLKDIYTFNTIQGLDTYPFDYNHWSTVQSPAYCMKRPIALYTNKWNFYGQSYNWQFQDNFASGVGTSGPYSGTLTSTPILASVNNNPMVFTPAPALGPFPTGVPVAFPQANISRIQNILITANTATSSLHVTDDSAGNLIGDCLPNGTINYQTGVISNLRFSAAIPSGNPIQAQYSPYQPTVPLSILFQQQQFILRPVPDRGYPIEITAYRLPSQALLGSEDPNNPNTAGVPELLEWWETIAFGAAKKAFEDRWDDDGVASMDKSLKERYANNEARTYAQLGSQKIDTIFTDQLDCNYGYYGLTFGNPGGKS